MRSGALGFPANRNRERRRRLPTGCHARAVAAPAKTPLKSLGALDRLFPRV